VANEKEKQSKAKTDCTRSITWNPITELLVCWAPAEAKPRG